MAYKEPDEFIEEMTGLDIFFKFKIPRFCGYAQVYYIIMPSLILLLLLPILLGAALKGHCGDGSGVSGQLQRKK